MFGLFSSQDASGVYVALCSICTASSALLIYGLPETVKTLFPFTKTEVDSEYLPQFVRNWKVLWFDAVLVISNTLFELIVIANSDFRTATPALGQLQLSLIFFTLYADRFRSRFLHCRYGEANPTTHKCGRFGTPEVCLQGGLTLSQGYFRSVSIPKPMRNPQLLLKRRTNGCAISCSFPQAICPYCNTNCLRRGEDRSLNTLIKNSLPPCCP